MTCISGSNFPSGYQCECAAGFEGATCDVDVNECASDPCLRGGVCRDLPNGFECRCITGFTGQCCGHALCVVRLVSRSEWDLNNAHAAAPNGLWFS